VNHVVEAYCPIIKKHMNDPFTQEQKDWQQIRRGR
jgi:coproporphyrinogen III oxidase